jgi:hypothetical protein
VRGAKRGEGLGEGRPDFLLSVGYSVPYVPPF